jgi:hypothetical protein
MTYPSLTPINQGNGEYLDVRARQGQLMLVRVWDVAEEVVTANNPDGWVYPRGKDPFPNKVVRAAIADLGQPGADGQPGKVFPEAWIQASSLMKEIRKWAGQLKLVIWRQKDPSDKSSLYDLTDMSGDAQAMAMYEDFMKRHPEFFELTAPAPYERRVREQRQPPAQRPPQQDQWQQPYGQQQPGWNQQPPQQWQPPVPPAQPPAAWNTAAPPPEYYTQQPQWAQQQQGPPPQQAPQYPQPGYNAPQIQGYMQQMDQAPPQGYGQPPAPQGPPQQWQPQGPPQQGPPPPQAPQGGGSFFAASQGQPAPQQWQSPQQPNHQGQWQNDEPPF